MRALGAEPARRFPPPHPGPASGSRVGFGPAGSERGGHGWMAKRPRWPLDPGALSRAGAPRHLKRVGLWDPWVRAASLTLTAAPGSPRSPVHAVADPGTTDSWAMPERVLQLGPRRVLSASTDPSRPPSSPTPSGRAQEDQRPAASGQLRSWQSSGCLPLELGPHPPGHVTGERAACVGRA